MVGSKINKKPFEKWLRELEERRDKLLEAQKGLSPEELRKVAEKALKDLY